MMISWSKWRPLSIGWRQGRAMGSLAWQDRESIRRPMQQNLDLQPEPEIAQRNGTFHDLLQLAPRFGGVLEDPEDDELARTHRRDVDLADQPAVEDIVLRHRGF